jgi:hypothetical protein
VICAAFRTRKCASPMFSSLIFGNNQSSKGRTILEVFAEENSCDDAKDMRAIHMINGT